MEQANSMPRFPRPQMFGSLVRGEPFPVTRLKRKAPLD
jgi:hypothetical protein